MMTDPGQHRRFCNTSPLFYIHNLSYNRNWKFRYTQFPNLDFRFF